MKTAIDAHEIRAEYMAQSISAIVKTAIAALGALTAKVVFLGNAFSA